MFSEIVRKQILNMIKDLLPVGWLGKQKKKKSTLIPPQFITSQAPLMIGVQNIWSKMFFS